MVDRKNIKLFESTGKRLDFTIVDDAGKPLDLTGSTGTMRVWLDRPGANASDVFTKSVTIDDPEKGEVHVDILETDTNIDVAVYRFVLEFDFGSGDKRTLWSGSLEIVGDDQTRIQQIKSYYGLNFKYLQLKSALDWAREQMKTNASETVNFTTTAKKSEFKIGNYVSDRNFDDVVDVNDITIREFQKDSPYGINDLSGNVSTILFDHPSGDTIIQMDATYPSDNSFTVEIEYERIVCPYTDAQTTLHTIEEYYLLYRLFSILPPHKLQQGLTEKTINGVTMRYDHQTIEEFKKKLWLDIRNEIMKIAPFNGTSVQIPKSYDSPGQSSSAFQHSHSANMR